MMRKILSCVLPVVFICAVLVSCVFAIEIVRQKNVATHIMFPLVDADGDIVTAATGLDSEFTYFDDSTAGINWADCTNEAVEIEPASGWYDLSIAQSETNHDYIAIQVKTSTSGAKTQNILIRTIVGDPLNLATTDDGGTINVTAGKIDEVAALTGHTAQTGDSYSIVNSGTYGNSALKSLIDAVPTASEIQAELEENGASTLDTIADKLPTHYIMGSSDQTDQDDDIAAILTDTGTTIPGLIGALNNLSAAAVNAEIVDVVETDNKLNLLIVGSATLSSDVALASILGQLFDDGTSWSYDRSTDALEQISGLAGGTDWSANEKTEIKAILGVTGTGTPDSTPAEGALKGIQDSQTTAQADLDNPSQYKATGFSTHSAADVVTAMQAVAGDFKADVSGLATSSGLADLQAHGDINWLTATGFSTHSAADVWAVGTRALTDKAGFSLAADQSGVTIGTVTTLTNWEKTGYALSSAGIDAIWDEVITGHTTADSFGKVFDDQIDGLRAYGDINWATATGFSTHSAADVWAVGTRTITGLTAAALADFFDTNSGTTSSAAVAGSVVKEIVDNAGGSGLTEAGIADAVWDEVISDHLTAGTTGAKLNEMPTPYDVGP